MHLPSIPNTARARCRGVLFFIVLCLAAATGCSHVRPFYRENSLFAHLHSGFMVVDFLEDGSVWLSVVEPGPEEVVFHLRLDLQRP